MQSHHIFMCISEIFTSARCSDLYCELPGWAGGGRLSCAAAAGLRRLLQATGGELFERIGSRAHFSETEAARCFYQVIAAARRQRFLKARQATRNRAG
jgi:hypothetical protein